MHVTIGILAFNESAMIGRTVRSLFEQSVFAPGNSLADVHWEIVVVPNGCTDDTHARAVAALQAACAGCAAGVKVGFRVESLERGGKSYAWNQLIHDISTPSTDAFVMIDADIEFGHRETIANCVSRLRSDDHAWAVVDLPLKDFHRKPDPSWIERWSLRASDHKNDGPAAIAGSFYVVAAPRLRSIWMPIGLPGEDGFLCLMIMTDGFRRGADYSRIVRADNASHYFEGLSRPSAIIRHEVRMFVGTVINALLCWDMLLYMTPRNGPGAGALIRDLNAQNPDWFKRFINNQIEIRGWWAFRTRELWRHLTEWRRMPWPRRVKRLPLTLLLFGVDLVVVWRANRQLVSGRAVGFW